MSKIVKYWNKRKPWFRKRIDSFYNAYSQQVTLENIFYFKIIPFLTEHDFYFVVDENEFLKLLTFDQFSGVLTMEHLRAGFCYMAM